MTTSNFGMIEQEASKLDAESLILFDVDGTLIVPNDAILKPLGKSLFDELIASYVDRDLFREIRMKALHSLVDNRSMGFVQKLQRNNIPVIAFTAAPSKVCEGEPLGLWRVNELKKYGFDFSPAFPYLKYIELPKDVNQSYTPLFNSGVLYSSFHSKGVILISFLQQQNLKPTKIIFVDDELPHVESVVAALDEQGIPCLGIHYTAANEFACDLNFERARFQINYFITHDIWLSDQECVGFY